MLVLRLVTASTCLHHHSKFAFLCLPLKIEKKEEKKNEKKGKREGEKNEKPLKNIKAILHIFLSISIHKFSFVCWHFF